MTIPKWIQVVFWVACLMAISYVITTYVDDPTSHYFGLFVNIMLFMACVMMLRRLFIK
jgi:hypothetical protein